jgi:hypothetical protein
MSQFCSFTRSFTVIPLATALLFVLAGVWSCGTSGSGRWSGEKDIDRAVAAYIEGDYTAAVERLEALSTQQAGEDQLREIYWYLGRSLVAMGQYHRAIDAFTVGKANGGGAEFDEYLARLGALVSGEPENVARSDRVTRAQLAVVIDQMFYGESSQTQENPGPSDTSTRLEDLAPVARGVVAVLPDGRFHPEAYVTRASFYAAVSRLVREKDIDVDTGLLFDGGFQWALAADDGGERYVTGKQVVATLQRVAAAQNTYGG